MLMQEKNWERRCTHFEWIGGGNFDPNARMEKMWDKNERLKTFASAIRVKKIYYTFLKVGEL